MGHIDSQEIWLHLTKRPGMSNGRIGDLSLDSIAPVGELDASISLFGQLNRSSREVKLLWGEVHVDAAHHLNVALPLLRFLRRSP